MTATLVTAAEACQMLGMSRTMVYDLAKDGKLVRKFIGKGTRNFRITVESIEAYSQSLSQDPTPIEVDA